MLLIIATLIGCKRIIQPILAGYVSRFFMSESYEERQILKDIREKKKQLLAISMVDQFSDYAKLQRKINTLQEQHKGKVLLKNEYAKRMNFIFTMIFNIVTSLCSLGIYFYYSNFAVVVLPEDILWPFSAVFALPFCKSGEISAVGWIFIVYNVSGRLPNIIKSLKNMKSDQHLNSQKPQTDLFSQGYYSDIEVD